LLQPHKLARPSYFHYWGYKIKNYSVQMEYSTRIFISSTVKMAEGVGGSTGTDSTAMSKAYLFILWGGGECTLRGYCATSANWGSLCSKKKLKRKHIYNSTNTKGTTIKQKQHNLHNCKHTSRNYLWEIFKYASMLIPLRNAYYRSWPKTKSNRIN
jgi:hypothetical protein